VLFLPSLCRKPESLEGELPEWFHWSAAWK